MIAKKMVKKPMHLQRTLIQRFTHRIWRILKLNTIADVVQLTEHHSHHRMM